MNIVIDRNWIHPEGLGITENKKMEHTERSKTLAGKGRKSSSNDSFHPSRPAISREGFMLENRTPSGIYNNRYEFQ